MKLKIITLTILIVTISFTDIYSYPIISRRTKGGFFNFYDIVEKNMVDFQFTNKEGVLCHMLGWSITCKDAGPSWCPKKGGITAPTDPNYKGVDVIDDNQCDILVTYAQEKFQNNINSGSYTQLVQVQGELTLRAYTVTWNYDSSTGEYITNVDRNDVIL